MLIESRDALKKMAGDTRTFRVRFDPNQYQSDMEGADGKNVSSFIYKCGSVTVLTIQVDIYFTFNLLIRRDPKANNFKAV